MKTKYWFFEKSMIEYQEYCGAEYHPKENTMEQDRHEWAAFKQLPWKKKLEHLWFYYRWYLLVAAAVICVGVSIAGTVAENRKQTLISGIFINNSTSPEGYAYLSEDYWRFCGGREDQKTELIAGRYIHFDEESLSQEDAAAFMIVSSMIAAKTLDYIITDEASLDDFEEQEIVMDLGQLLPEEALARWETIGHDGAVTALKLGSSAFAEACPLESDESVLLVVANAQNHENVVRFLYYLMDGQ